MGYFERFIAEHELRDTSIFSPNGDNDYCGIGVATLTQRLAVALSVADILLEIEQVLRVVGPAGSSEALRRRWREMAASASCVRALHAQLPGLIDWLAGIPRREDPATQPRVVVTGDFFTRFSDFFMEGVQDRYAQHGIILKPVDLDELVLYSIYNGLVGTAHDWGLEPGAIYIPETARVSQLLQRFRARRQHLAIVLDEYGGTAGVVTLEDLLEQIVGDVQGPFDKEPEIQPQPDGSAWIDGLTLMEEVNDRFGLQLEDPHYDTIAGYMLGRLGRMARLGDVVLVSGVRLEVRQMDGLRIAQVRLSRSPAAAVDPGRGA